MNATDRMLASIEAAALRLLVPTYLRALTVQLQGELATEIWAEFARILERALVLAHLVGRTHVLNHLQMQGTRVAVHNRPLEEVRYADLPDGSHMLTGAFLEALKAFETRVPRLAGTLLKVGAKARAQAFAITGLEGTRGLRRLKARIQATLAGPDGAQAEGLPAPSGAGGGLAGFVAEGQDLGLGVAAAQLETVYRVNVMHALNQGTKDMLAAPDVAEHVALLQLNEIHDRRTRGNPNGLYPDAPPHFQMDGFVERPTHPVWEKITPPNGFNCRGSISPLTWVRAEQMGLARASERVLLQAAIDQHNGARWGYINRGEYPDPGFK